ncbi:MAG: hypothetical protein ACT4PL_05185 [Phycisphaerales bacterium]
MPPDAPNPSRRRPRRAHDAIAIVVDTGQAFISRLRLRALIWVVGIALATIAAVLFTSISWIPAISVAFAAAAVSVSKVAARLSRPVCWTCGHDLTGQPLGGLGGWGAACPNCGAIHMPRPDQVAGAQVEQQVEQEHAETQA